MKVNVLTLSKNPVKSQNIDYKYGSEGGRPVVKSRGSDSVG